MKNINRFFLIILVVLFALGMASLFFSIMHLYGNKPPPEVAPKDEPPVEKVDIHSSEETVSPKVPEEVISAAPSELPNAEEKVDSSKVNSSEKASDVSKFQLNDVLELEKKRAAIIKKLKLLLEKSKTLETVPSIPDQRKTWAEVGDQLMELEQQLMELEQQRENSINSLNTPTANQQDGK